MKTMGTRPRRSPRSAVSARWYQPPIEGQFERRSGGHSGRLAGAGAYRYRVRRLDEVGGFSKNLLFSSRNGSSRPVVTSTQPASRVRTVASRVGRHSVLAATRYLKPAVLGASRTAPHSGASQSGGRALRGGRSGRPLAAFGCAGGRAGNSSLQEAGWRSLCLGDRPALCPATGLSRCLRFYLSSDSFLHGSRWLLHDASADRSRRWPECCRRPGWPPSL